MKRFDFEILLVEDNPADARLVKDCFPMNGDPVRFVVARDGEEALDYLHRRGRFAERGSPGLVLLDLNIPRRNGKEVLREFRESSAGRMLPILILSSSENEEEIRSCYELGATCFLCKPRDLEEMTRLLESIESFWLKLVRFPRPPESNP